MNTPRTNEALAALLERDGELSEENAPEVLVKLCKELESTTERLWLEIDSRKIIESDFQNEIMSMRQVTEKAVSLVKFWEAHSGGNGVMARAKEDALILACGSLHNAGSVAPLP
jgi:predicted naringenin-chalcone synthase